MLNILICAFESGIFQVEKNLPEPKSEIKYFISWQGINLDTLAMPTSLTNRNDVFIKKLKGKGLSRNRNNCIQLAKDKKASGFFLIADDDVEFLPGFEKIISSTFQSNLDYGIICFQVLSSDKNLVFKNYWKQSRPIDLKNIDKISSIEIAGRMEVLDKITFDERLGLGALFPSGEEIAFLADAIREAIKILFYPEYIVSHPAETSGKKRVKKFLKEDLYLIGGRAYRIYGERLAKSFFLFSAIKNYSSYRKNISFFTYLRYLNEGLKSFKKTEHA